MDSIGEELPTTVDLQLAAWDRNNIQHSHLLCSASNDSFSEPQKELLHQTNVNYSMFKNNRWKRKIIKFHNGLEARAEISVWQIAVFVMGTYCSVIYFLFLMRTINHGCSLFKSFHVIRRYFQNKLRSWEISFIVLKMDLLSLSHTVYSGCTRLDFNHVKCQYFLLTLTTTIRRINVTMLPVKEQKIKMKRQ